MENAFSWQILAILSHFFSIFSRNQSILFSEIGFLRPHTPPPSGGASGLLPLLATPLYNYYRILQTYERSKNVHDIFIYIPPQTVIIILRCFNFTMKKFEANLPSCYIFVNLVKGSLIFFILIVNCNFSNCSVFIFFITKVFAA